MSNGKNNLMKKVIYKIRGKGKTAKKRIFLACLLFMCIAFSSKLIVVNAEEDVASNGIITGFSDFDIRSHYICIKR